MRVFVCDSEVSNHFRAGNPGVLAEVYLVHVDSIRRFIGQSIPAIPSAASDAEDLVQETFLRAFSERARKRYDGLRPLIAYLIAIARNLLADRRRASIRLAAVVATRDLQSSPSSTDVENEVSDRELLKICNDFFDTLTPAQRTVFVMRFIEETSRDATSKATGLTVPRIRATETWLRRRLTEQMSGGTKPPPGENDGQT